jgi:hypothetical protein
MLTNLEVKAALAIEAGVCTCETFSPTHSDSHF